MRIGVGAEVKKWERNPQDINIYIRVVLVGL
jgi:hypothetical protein